MLHFVIPRMAAVAVVSGCLLLAACAPHPAASLATDAPRNQFAADSTLRRIATLQDERRTAGLLPYLQHPQARYRRAAAEALASVQDKTATPALIALLHDTDGPTLQAAAYALGQIGDSTAVDALATRIMVAGSPLRRYASEALGRCVTRRSLPKLWRITATPDTTISVAVAWGLLRAGLRGVTSEAAVTHAVALLEARQPLAARQGAAFTLARTPRLNLTPYQAALTAASSDTNPIVRAAVASALGKVDNPAVAPVLATLARRDNDYRVRVSALRAMTASMYAPVKEAVWAALSDDNGQVALTAAEFFLAHAANEPGTLFLEKANRLAQWRVRATLLAAALRQPGPERAAIRRAIEERYAATSDVYEKGFLLKALSEDPEAFSFVQQATFTPNQPVVIGTYGMEALVALRRQTDFPTSRYPEVAAALRRGVLSGDVAMMGTAAEAIRDPKLEMRRLLPNPDFLVQARSRLVLPRDLEAWQSIQQTIDFLQQQPSTAVPVASAATHPIDWGVVATIPAGQRAVVHTSKGDVVMRLLVEQAPGSVASFVTLIRQGFYNGKNFHRVVPNFVAQGGCPRGDGWGSSDYNLRSEFASSHYGEGAVGLASAGKDTESCQWFITHAPTPHLDGRYTIFAQVVQGMDVVSRLEIGDRIDKVELLK